MDRQRIRRERVLIEDLSRCTEVLSAEETRTVEGGWFPVVYGAFLQWQRANRPQPIRDIGVEGDAQKW